MTLSALLTGTHSSLLQPMVMYKPQPWTYILSMGLLTQVVRNHSYISIEVVRELPNPFVYRSMSKLKLFSQQEPLTITAAVTTILEAKQTISPCN
jgi:hypothetical protein